MSDMRKILKSFDAVQRKTLNEAFVVECPPDMPTMETGGDLSINITGDAASMSQILRALAGIQGGRMSMGTSMHDDPSNPGRDDVEGDQDLNQGIIGTTLGGALGAGLGLATGAGPMATTLGALSGAAAGDSLTDRDEDDPRIPGRDDVEGDVDLQQGVLGNIGTTAGQTVKHGAVGAGIGAALGGAAGMALGGPAGAIQGAKLGGLGGAALGGAAGRGAATAKMTKQELQAGSKDNPRIPGRDDVEGDTDLQQDISGLATTALDALKGFGTQAADAVAQGSQAAGDAIATGAKAAGDAAASTGLGQRAIDAMGQASDWAADKGASIGSKIGSALGGAYGGATDGITGAGIGAGLGGYKGAEIGAKIGKIAPAAAAAGAGLAVGSKALGGTGDKKLRQSAAEMESEYDASTEPNEKYWDHKLMTKDLSGGINRQKKMHKPAAKGDNPMAVEMKSRLEAKLAEKKNAKPDFLDMDKDGNKKEPMKKALKDKGGAPKKGKVPPQFAKKESVEEASQDLDRMKQLLGRLL